MSYKYYESFAKASFHRRMRYHQSELQDSFDFSIFHIVFFLLGYSLNFRQLQFNCPGSTMIDSQQNRAKVANIILSLNGSNSL